MEMMRRLLAAATGTLMGAALVVGFGPARPSLASATAPAREVASTQMGHSPAGAAAPEIFGLAPAQGPVAGGTRVTIAGSGFTAATSVEFGGVAAGSVHVLSPSVLTAVTPAGAAGRGSIVVSTADGCSAQSNRTSTFAYVAAQTVT